MREFEGVGAVLNASHPPLERSANRSTIPEQTEFSEAKKKGSERVAGRSEVILGRFLAESWIGIAKSFSLQLSQFEMGQELMRIWVR